MAIRRMEHVGIVVDDLAAAVAFFGELGMEPQGDGSVEGEWVDRIVGLEAIRAQFAMLQTPDGGGRIELVRFDAPPAGAGDAGGPANTMGLRHLAFSVDDVDDTVARLEEKHGAELVGEIVRYGNAFRLCYLRGPEGIIVELAEPLG
jgi:catechol 2,3-dioxygenase-like lactoylglutathione lyase family enzyme